MSLTSIHPLVLRELDMINAASQTTSYHAWKGVLFVNDQPYNIPLVLKVHLKRDYLDDFTDRLRVTIKCDSAIYSNYIYPNRDKLKLTLVRKPVSVRGGGSRVDQLYQYDRYDAVLVGVSNDAATGENPFAGNKQLVNTHMIRNVEFQITSRTVTRLRGTSVSTNIHNSTAVDAIKTILTNYSTDSTDSASDQVLGVDVAEGFSTEIRPQIMIPQGKKIYQLPDIIHRSSSGVYQTGFSYYLQANHWYLFSPYDVKRFDRATDRKTLTIINVPSYQLPAIEKTYRDTGTQLIVIANGETKQLDTTERAYLNKGVGVRYADADHLLSTESEYAAGKVKSTPDQYMSEYTSTQRPDGMNLLSDDTPITANPSIEYGKLAERNGIYFGVIWDNASPEKIYPGMPVKYIYIKNGMPVYQVGTVVGNEIQDTVANSDVNNPIFSSTCFLKLFLERSES